MPAVTSGWCHAWRNQEFPFIPVLHMFNVLVNYYSVPRATFEFFITLRGGCPTEHNAKGGLKKCRLYCKSRSWRGHGVSRARVYNGDPGGSARAASEIWGRHPVLEITDEASQWLKWGGQRGLSPPPLLPFEPPAIVWAPPNWIYKVLKLVLFYA